MRTVVTERGQVSVPAGVRRRLHIGPHSVLEWVVEGESVRVIPLPKDPVGAFRGSGKKGAVGRLLADRRRDLARERT